MTLNWLSISLVFAQPLVSGVGGAGVLAILLWHARASSLATPRQN
jgi:hypothetical protein